MTTLHRNATHRLKFLVWITATLLLVACGGSDSVDDDDDDIALPVGPPTDDESTPKSIDGTWRTACVFMPSSLLGQYQIREYVRNGVDTAYVTDYFNDSECTDSRDNRLLMRGTSEFIEDKEEAVFGVSTRAVRFVATEFYLGGNLVDLPVDPFNDLVYVANQTELLLGNSETLDDITGIPSAIDWVVLYTSR